MANRPTNYYPKFTFLLNTSFQNSLFWGILIIFILISLFSAVNESLTYDEIMFSEYGQLAVQRKDFFTDPYNPPLLPILTYIPSMHSFNNDKMKLEPNISKLPNRLVIIILGLVTIMAVYLVSKAIFSGTVGLLAALIISLDPSFLANSHYITLDTGTTLFFFLSVISFTNYMNKNNIKNLVFFSLNIGLLFASRIFGLTYFFGFIFLFVIYNFFTKRVIRINIIHFIFSTLIILGVIWSSYFFTYGKIIADSDRTGRVSDLLIQYARDHDLSILGDLIIFVKKNQIPLGTYISLIKNNFLRSQSNGNIFFLGEHQPIMFYMMPLLFLLKTPLYLLVFFLVGTYYMIGFEKQIIVRALFIAPIAILLISSITGMNPWYRYLLPMSPFLSVIAAYGINRFVKKIGHIPIVFIILWHIVSLVYYYPHFLPYVNELSKVIGNNYQLYSDSNIDWGQGIPSLIKYVHDKNISLVSFSYHGRDDAEAYGFSSSLMFGGYKKSEICSFHPISNNKSGHRVEIISISNWNDCGYRKQIKYSPDNIRDVVVNEFLVFDASE